MRYPDISRRQFLGILISLPVAYTIGCETDQRARTSSVSVLSPEESLKKLIFLLGPWPDSDRKEAEDFAGRFLKSDYTAANYLPESAELVQSLAARFSGDTMVRQIDLRELPPKERELLLNLVRQIYSFIEVRSYVSKEPPWGECQGDRTRYTFQP